MSKPPIHPACRVCREHRDRSGTCAGIRAGRTFYPDCYMDDDKPKPVQEKDDEPAPRH